MKNSVGAFVIAIIIVGTIVPFDDGDCFWNECDKEYCEFQCD